MKILAISISAPPKNSPEGVQTGRYLQHIAKNHDVTLLTTKISGGWEPFDESLKKLISNVKQVITLPVLPPRLIALLNKIIPSVFIPDTEIFFYKQFGWARKKIQKPDVIYSRSAPFSSAIMAQRFSNHENIPWVMHLSDPWADNPFHAFSEKNNQLESVCVARANVITLTSQKTVYFYQEKYPQFAQKFRLLPNVFDENTINQQTFIFHGKIKFVFTGRLYANRTIHAVVRAAEEAFKKRPDLETTSEFIFAGFFADENIETIHRSSLTNIKYVGPLSSTEATRLQQEASVLISIDSSDEQAIYDLFFPSKLLDYLAAKRPIIALTRKTSTTFDVVEGKYGKCFYPENLNQLPDHFIFLMDAFVERNRKVFELTADFSEFSSVVNANKLMDIFKEVMEAHG